MFNWNCLIICLTIVLLALILAISSLVETRYSNIPVPEAKQLCDELKRLQEQNCILLDSIAELQKEVFQKEIYHT